MYIFIAPCGARENSRLDKRVVKAAIVLPGLERETKGDLLISPLSGPPLKSITDSKRSRLALLKHCQAGILVQNKFGCDLINSIPELPFTLDRMRAWCPRPWLVYTGSFSRTLKGKVKCNGRTTKRNFNSFTGALESWRAQGGIDRWLGQDSDIVNWIGHMKKVLAAIENDEPVIISRPLRRTISRNCKDPAERAKALLRRLPGIGKIKANLIIDHCGSFIMGLAFATDEDNRGQCGLSIGNIRGIRSYIGLKSNQYIHIREEKFK